MVSLNYLSRAYLLKVEEGNPFSHCGFPVQSSLIHSLSVFAFMHVYIVRK